MSGKTEMKQLTSLYKGLTKKNYKRLKAKEGSNSEPGVNKGSGCIASPLQKGIIKYPRWYRTDPVAYTAMNGFLDRTANKPPLRTLSGNTLKIRTDE